MILSQPVKRRTILAGRFCASLAVTMSLTSIHYLFVVIGLFGFYQAIPPSLGLSLLVCIPFASASLGLAFLFSSLFRQSTTAVVLGVLVIVVLFPLLQGILATLVTEPWFLLSYSGEVIADVIPTQYPAHVQKIPPPGKYEVPHSSLSITRTSWKVSCSSLAT